MKKLLAAIIFAPAFVFAEAPVGIDSLPKLIREQNQRVRAARDFLRAAEREAGHLGRSYLPTVEAEAGRETFRTGEEDRRTEPYGTIGAELNVFRGGQDKYYGRQKSADVEAALAEYDQALRSELQKARDVFWALAFQREMEKALQEAMRANETFLKSAEKRIASGITTSTDRLEFEMFRRQLEQDLARLKTEISRAEKTLLLLTQSSATIVTPAAIPHDHAAPPLASAFDPASHPSVRALDASYAGAKAFASQAARWWTPSVDLYSHYSLYTFRDREFDDKENRDDTVLGGRVSLLLFDGMQSRAGSKASYLRSEGFAKSREQAERELRLEAELTQAELQQLHDLVHSAEEGVELGGRYLKNTASEYSRGVKNSPDVINALEKNVELKERDAAIRRDYQLVKARFLALVGEP